MDNIYLLHSAEYQLLQQGFGEWLQALGYAPVTVTALPRHVAGVPSLPGAGR